MKLLLPLLIALLAPVAGVAQQFPAAFKVVGVASDDVLNVRLEPDARSMLLDQLMPFATDVEVVRLSPNRKWGMVQAGETMGWASMRYLARIETAAPGRVPRPMRCSGTEPFWRLEMYPQGSEFELAGEPADALTVSSEAAAPQGYLVEFAGAANATQTLTIQRGYCDDGMSELEFGFRGVLFTAAPNANRVLSGCCTMDNH